jgi:hypothetical protein
MDVEGLQRLILHELCAHLGADGRIIDVISRGFASFDRGAGRDRGQHDKSRAEFGQSTPFEHDVLPFLHPSPMAAVPPPADFPGINGRPAGRFRRSAPRVVTSAELRYVAAHVINKTG